MVKEKKGNSLFYVCLVDDAEYFRKFVDILILLFINKCATIYLSSVFVV